ncbi:hypothetical protein ACJIZ3_006626 [Penstemon smallii]|uniref:Uncharacterized protein n=1 Tax=Penstemon smallii TaxID=265156 RepID=A0ABD3S8G6_9LAMI
MSTPAQLFHIHQHTPSWLLCTESFKKKLRKEYCVLECHWTENSFQFYKRKQLHTDSAKISQGTSTRKINSPSDKI